MKNPKLFNFETTINDSEGRTHAARATLNLDEMHLEFVVDAFGEDYEPGYLEREDLERQGMELYSSFAGWSEDMQINQRS